ncbi:MAG: hypothetical protein KatS3mg109_0417 [Pirellulaceae bacterium]|nr:MAG: hypothetical protein KatS3mg109_0417 [Pirellulaceae bacterium]
MREPWASLIAQGSKRIENRSWYTSYRGLVVIHAARRPAVGRAGECVAVVRLVDVVPLATVAGAPYAEGPWCWLLEPICQLPRGLRLRGAVGLRRVDQLSPGEWERLEQALVVAGIPLPQPAQRCGMEVKSALVPPPETGR